MAEKRKPSFTLLLKIPGKRTGKLEFFKRELFTDKPMPKRHTRAKYRLRVQGKWYPKDKSEFYASWEIKELFWRSLSL